MPLPEGYLPREGDVVVVHAVVEHDYHATSSTKMVALAPRKYAQTFYIDLDQIIGIHRYKWEVGDLVTYSVFGVGQIIAMHEDLLWVRFDGGEMQTLDAGIVSRVPEKQEIEPAAPEPAPRPSPSDADEEIKF